MRTIARSAAIALIFGLTSSVIAKPIALVGGRLIDGFGGPPLANSVIIIENERITAVGTVDNLKPPADADIISTEGMSVLPGLWDCHVHTMLLGHSDYDHWDKTYPQRFASEIMPAAAHQLLMAGVTSARDLGAPLEDSIQVRDRINRGEIPGPTLYVAGPFIQHEPYPGTEAFRWGVKGAADAKAKVKKIADAGALVKDLDIGLLDFMTRYKAQDVCLCWRLGESGIHFWHGETEGFGGRKPIDYEFLQNHGVTDIGTPN